jgi:hypothetical protein
MINRKKNLFVFINLAFIIVGIALISVVDRTTGANTGSGDIRARAGEIKHLTAYATVLSSDPIKGMLIVTDLFFTDESRSGEAKNLGSWVVRAPVTFNFSTISPGAGIVIGIDSAAFLISKHSLTAASITLQK